MNIKRTFFTVDAPIRTATSCDVCDEYIEKGGMRIIVPAYSTRHYFHFECYKPKLDSFIEQKDIKVKLKLPEHLDKFNAWLIAWNAKKHSSFSPIPITQKFVTKVVGTEHSKRHRAWIETLSFLTGTEMVKVVPLVCKEFYHISWQGELWRSYCIQEFDLTPDSADARMAYISNCLNRCLGCRKVPSPALYYRCPMLKRVLCKQCTTSHGEGKKFSLINKSQIESVYSVNLKLLDLEFADGPFNQKFTYVFKLKQALVKFYARNRELLVQELTTIKGTEALVAEIAELSPKKLMCMKTEYQFIPIQKFLPRIDLSKRTEAFRQAHNFITSAKHIKRCLETIKRSLATVTN
mmetsp:Transcript_6149/g.10758  ORF Transcript_6149/g.10758 Transcript_6149/m.10758 type:complete len:350 (+) Transcript_6149:202-1251(+)